MTIKIGCRRQPGGLPMALAWQRKASAWLSARHGPVQVVLAKGGPAPFAAAGFQVAKPLADQLG